MRAGRNCANHDRTDAEHMLAEPVVEIDPAQNDRERRTTTEQTREETREDPRQRGRIENRREQQRSEEWHQMSAQTAIRRSTSLLYSPKRARKLGSVVTPSVTIGYFAP